MNGYRFHVKPHYHCIKVIKVYRFNAHFNCTKDPEMKFLFPLFLRKDFLFLEMSNVYISVFLMKVFFFEGQLVQIKHHNPASLLHKPFQLPIYDNN